MKFLLLEDDQLQADALTQEIRRNFTGAQVELIATELEFRKRFDKIAANPPDIFILDMMVRWTNPSVDMEPIPEDIATEGYYRAGLRCQRMLAESAVMKPIPVIFYSVLDRGDYEAGLDHLPNVVKLSKGMDGRLSAVIRSLFHGAMTLQNHKPAVFVVHGHDDEAKETVARFIERLGLCAVVLHEQPNAGRTIIEKFEDYANVAYAVVLLTPDDLAKSKAGKNLRARARQNVVLELGYFAAKLGRRNVCALYKPDVEIPSDFQGVLYISMDSAGGWRSQLAREMKAAGLPIDAEKIL